MPQVKARLIFEMMGRPPKHLKEQLNTHVIKMGSEKGIKIKELPISYKPRSIAEGKKINWKDGLAAIWHIIRFNLFTKK